MYTTPPNVGADIERAAEILRNGGVVAVPTETVYGLAADATNPAAVARLFEIKRRPANNPLIVHVTDWAAAVPLVWNPPPIAGLLAETFWPGPLTLVLQKSHLIPDLVTGGLPTIALRAPNHPMTQELLHKVGVPLAAPSANLFGMVSPTTATHVSASIGNLVDYILDGGPCAVGLESTIVAVEPTGALRILRAGIVTANDLARVTGVFPETVHAQEGPPEAPGMYPRHYAPVTPLRVGPIRPILHELPWEVRVAAITLVEPIAHPQVDFQVQLCPDGNLETAARNLYDALHRADAQKLDLILVEPMPDWGVGAAMNDRLRRAATTPGPAAYGDFMGE